MREQVRAERERERESLEGLSPVHAITALGKLGREERWGLNEKKSLSLRETASSVLFAVVYGKK